MVIGLVLLDFGGCVWTLMDLYWILSGSIGFYWIWISIGFV